MLALMMVAAAVIGLGDRTGFAGPGEQERYSAWLAKAAADHDAAAAGSACPQATVTSVSAKVVARNEMPDKLSAEPAPGFSERVRVDGCGRAVTHNILVFRTRTGVGNFILLPGETLTSPRLMADVAAAAPGVIPEVGKGACPDPKTAFTGVWGETTVLSQPDAAGAWVERWPLKVCGVDRPIVVTFTPRTDGGTDFSVALSWR